MEALEITEENKKARRPSLPVNCSHAAEQSAPHLLELLRGAVTSRWFFGDHGLASWV